AVLDVVRLPEPALTADGELQVDEPRTLDAFLNAVRWGATTNADANVLESPYRSGIEIVDYQLEPLVRSLDMSRISLLIADDVGRLDQAAGTGSDPRRRLSRRPRRGPASVRPAHLGRSSPGCARWSELRG